MVHHPVTGQISLAQLNRRSTGLTAAMCNCAELINLFAGLSNDDADSNLRSRSWMCLLLTGRQGTQAQANRADPRALPSDMQEHAIAVVPARQSKLARSP